jgi:hypothetical protein
MTAADPLTWPPVASDAVGRRAIGRVLAELVDDIAGDFGRNDALAVRSS